MSHRPPPSDAFTRFTSTSPHASQRPQRPSSSATASSGFNLSNEGETPAEKVARLRAASRASKAKNSMPLVDRMIDRGRVVADISHRIFAYGLIGFTGIAAAFSVYGITSLVMHNRRQKRAWIDRELGRLRDAQTAFLHGNATAEQLHLLEQERAGEEMAGQAKVNKERRKQEGVWSKLKGLMGTGTAVGEMGREDPAEIEAAEMRRGGMERLLEEGWVSGEVKAVAVAREDVETGIKGVGLDSKGRPVPVGRAVQEREQSMQKRAREAFEDERRTGEKEVEARTGIRGGPLDVLAGNVVGAVSPSGSRDWLSWVRGSKS